MIHIAVHRLRYQFIWLTLITDNCLSKYHTISNNLSTKTAKNTLVWNCTSCRVVRSTKSSINKNAALFDETNLKTFSKRYGWHCEFSFSLVLIKLCLTVWVICYLKVPFNGIRHIKSRIFIRKRVAQLFSFV